MSTSGIYLLPEDVNASDTKMVLDFLNAASSAEEIAIAVEIPDELDVGVKVGARILAQRDQLGGFISLQQVYAVPYVGPERFTELVTNLSSARPPSVAIDPIADRELLNQITQRLNLLEAGGNASASILLQSINTDVLLGQDTLMYAELKGSNGRPLIDRELTVVTTWGILSGRAGVNPVKGNSITIRSDHLGLCRFRLSAAQVESLTSVEIASLTKALTLLGTTKKNPRDSLNALTEMARLYRAPGNDSLRRAIDVYFKRYGGDDQLNTPVDSLVAWPRIAVTVIAWLTPDTRLAATQIPSSLLNIEQRNWFYAWLWAYRQLLEQESSLEASLSDVNGDERTGSGILTDIFSRVGSFVEAQDGLIGQQLGQTFAANSLNNFLQKGLNNVSIAERSKVMTGVTSGVKSLGSTQAFSTLRTSRADVNMQIDSSVASVDSTTQIKDLESRLSTVESSALTLEDIADIRTDILSAANQETTLRIDQLNTSINRKADNTAVLDLENRLDAKADITRINQMGQQLTALSNQTKSLDTNLNEFKVGVNKRIDEIGTGGRRT